MLWLQQYVCRYKMQNLKMAIIGIKLNHFFKINQVIYFLAPVSLTNIKALAKILCWNKAVPKTNKLLILLL